jgi:hypothetical protein
MRKALARLAVFGMGVAVVALAAPITAAFAGYCTRPGYPVGCVGHPAAAPGAGARGVGVRPGFGAGAAGVGLAPRPGVGAYGAGATRGVGYGAPGAGVRPYNAGGPVNYPGRR